LGEMSAYFHAGLDVLVREANVLVYGALAKYVLLYVIDTGGKKLLEALGGTLERSKALIDARRILDPKAFKTVKFRAVGFYAT